MSTAQELPPPLPVDDDTATTYTEYLKAKKARARWAEEEKRLRNRIIANMGYADDDPNPSPLTAVDSAGVPLFKVTVGSWHGLDFNALRTDYPDVYAACETSKPTQTIKPI